MPMPDPRLENSTGREVHERIEITIRPDGTIEMEQKGFAGPSCVEDAIAQLIKNHSDVIEDRLTSDYSQPRPAVNVNYVQ